MNQLVKNPLTTAAISIATTCDYAGHLAKVNGYNDQVYCKKFYQIGNFVCLEDTKIKRIIQSDIEQMPFFNYEADSYHHATYIKIEKRFRKRKTAEHYYEINTKTVKLKDFHQANSFKESEKLDEWVTTSKEQALQKTNELEHKQNEENEEHRRKTIKIHAKNLYDYIVNGYGYSLTKKELRHAFREKTIKKRREDLKKKFIETHTIESLKLEELIEQKINELLFSKKEYKYIKIQELVDEIKGQKTT